MKLGLELNTAKPLILATYFSTVFKIVKLLKQSHLLSSVHLGFWHARLWWLQMSDSSVHGAL